MTKYSRIASDTTLGPSDKLLGSDITGASRNYTLASIEEYLLGLQGDRKVPIEKQTDFTTEEPNRVEGIRYINTVTGLSTNSAVEVNANSIYEVRDGDWYEILPQEGFTVWDKELQKNLFFTNDAWINEVITSTSLKEAKGVLETDEDASGFEFGIDEDDLASNSPTKFPYQKNVKAYVDALKVRENLNNVDNTSDADKPVSTAQQAEFNADRVRLTGLEEAQTGGLKSFTTLSGVNGLESYPTPNINDSYKVTNDPDPANNGFYHWVSGTTYVKDESPYITQTIEPANTTEAPSNKAVSDYIATLRGGLVASGETKDVSGGEVFTATSNISNNLAAETSNRINSDVALQNNIDSEIQDRIDNDAILQEKIDSIQFEGIKTYQLVSDLPVVSVLDNGLTAIVANDTDANNNGQYSVSGGIWVQNKTALEALIDSDDVEVITNQLFIKDRDYTVTGQQGYKIIRANFDFTTIPVDYANSIWEIRYAHDLAGATITLPENVTLNFQGGKFSNGTLIGDNTKIEANLNKIFGSDLIINKDNFNVFKFYNEWYGVEGDGFADDIGLQLSNEKEISISQLGNKGNLGCSIELVGGDIKVNRHLGSNDWLEIILRNIGEVSAGVNSPFKVVQQRVYKLNGYLQIKDAVLTAGWLTGSFRNSNDYSLYVGHRSTDTSTTGETITFTSKFKGDLYSYHIGRTDGGIFSVTIDGGTPINVDTYNSTTNTYKTKTFIARIEDNEIHTIVVTNTGTKNALSSGFKTWFNAFEIKSNNFLPNDYLLQPKTWKSGEIIEQFDERIGSEGRVYVAQSTGVSGTTIPSHTSGTVSDGLINWLVIQFTSYSQDEFMIQVPGSELEYAYQTNYSSGGVVDVGGNIHGNEFLKENYKVYLDGVLTDISNGNTYYAEQINIKQLITDYYGVYDSKTDIADVIQFHDFNNDIMNIRLKFNWLVTTDIGWFYSAMFPFLPYSSYGFRKQFEIFESPRFKVDLNDYEGVGGNPILGNEKDFIMSAEGRAYVPSGSAGVPSVNNAKTGITVALKCDIKGLNNYKNSTLRAGLAVNANSGIYSGYSSWLAKMYFQRVKSNQTLTVNSGEIWEMNNRYYVKLHSSELNN